MPTPSEWIQYVIEMLQPLGQVRVRSMFGGWGLFCDDVMFGLFAEEILYFKVDDLNRALFEEQELEPFTYTGGKRKPIQMSYYRAPDEIYDNPDAALKWGRIGLEAAQRQHHKK